MEAQFQHMCKRQLYFKYFAWSEQRKYTVYMNICFCKASAVLDQ